VTKAIKKSICEGKTAAPNKGNTATGGRELGRRDTEKQSSRRGREKFVSLVVSRGEKKKGEGLKTENDKKQSRRGERIRQTGVREKEILQSH